MRSRALSSVFTMGFAAALAACSGSSSSTTGGGGTSTVGSTGTTGTTGSGAGGATLSSTGPGLTTGTTSSGGGAATATTGTTSTGTTGTGGAGTGGAGTGGSASTTSGGNTTSSSSSGTTTTSATSSSGGPVTFGDGCNGMHTTVSGVVYAPNGTDPIPRVRVYDAVMINPYPASYCDRCSAPIDPAYASTTSAPDGTYTLNLDSAPQSAAIDFAIQIGRFRKHTMLPITPCTNNSPPKAAETLPGNSMAGDIPHIAVSSGNVDHLDAVLSQLGITEYDCYEGRKTAGASTATCQQAAGKVIADVIQDSTQLDPYHMLFLSCAPGAYAQFITNHNQAMMTMNTQSWVQNGGRMFVTDTAYDYIAQAFPGGITWFGASGSPQPVDAANEGCAPAPSGGGSAHTVPYTVTVDDALLAQWLQVGVHVLPPLAPSPPTVSIEGFYQPWSVIASLPPGATLIANGTMPIDPTLPTTNCASPTMMNVPLTAEFDVPTCGRVVFSSYHTYSAGGNAAIAQEKIMEYLIFAAAFCHM